MTSYLNPPPISHQSTMVDAYDLKVSQWVRPWNGSGKVDAVVVGVPLSRSSISASGASEAPLAVRQSWKSFTTYDVDHDVDISLLRVSDLGDIRMHTTDIQVCHENIEQGAGEVLNRWSSTAMPLFVGGDHSITCPLVKAVAHFYRRERIGLIQFDTHFDVRRLEAGGPSNGTPIRGLLQSGVLRGSDIFQIGIHGFANSKAYQEYVKEQGIHVYTQRQLREQGLMRVISTALDTLDRQVDWIYVTVDMDVLDQAFLPGSPGASPGGMAPWELFDAVHTLGKQKNVVAVDFVCFDPLRDIGNMSAKIVTHTMLSFLSGMAKKGSDER